MKEKIDFYLPCSDTTHQQALIDTLRHTPSVCTICLLTATERTEALPNECELLMVSDMTSTATLKQIASHCQRDYAAIVTRPVAIDLCQGSIDRLLRAATESGAPMVYADRRGHP